MPRQFIVPFGAVLLVPWLAQAQPVELAGGAGFILAQPALAYETRYVPPVANILEFTGEAGQALTLDRGRRPAVWGAVALFPTPHAGLEARVRYRSAPLEGTSGPYRVSLTYTSMQPPDYIPRQHTFERSDSWPDPEGELREFSLDLLAIGRFGDPRRVQVRVSGGLALIAISGTLETVGLTQFRLGGHSVLFSDQHEVELEFSRTWGIGAVGGVEVYRAFAPQAGVVAGARLVLPRTISAPANVSDVSTAAFPLTPAEAQAAIRPPPLVVRPWTIDVLAGIRAVF